MDNLLSMALAALMRGDMWTYHDCMQAMAREAVKS